ncbi:MAG: phytanoyl-CoA dioxygenase family protein [Pseudomonadota bacterium]
MLDVAEDAASVFADAGVVVLRNVIATDVIEGLRAVVDTRMNAVGTNETGYDLQAVADQVWAQKEAIETGAANRFDFSGVPGLVLGDKKARPVMDGVASADHAHGRFFYEAGQWRSEEAIRRAAFDTELPERVAELLGAKALRFFEDTIFARDPHTPQATVFHQDLDYFKISGEGRAAIAWVPLDPCSLENGVTRYIRGSHKWGQVFAANMFFSSTPLPESEHMRLEDIEANEGDYDIVHFDVEPGDVIIHDVLTVHGAGGNPSGRQRRAISFRYCDQDCRYFERPGAIPQTGISHNLRTGDELACRDYPCVFPKPWPGFELANLDYQSGGLNG